MPGCPETRVVMTGNLGEDPPEWNEAGHLTTKKGRDAIRKRLRDIADPLQLVVVCDMWLAGTDIPCLNTLYVDKPMKGHNLVQAISRVNRVFAEKPHGLVVDYIGIGDPLREATAYYARGGGLGELAAEVAAAAWQEFKTALVVIRTLVPTDRPYRGWRRLSKIALDDLLALVYGTFVGHEDETGAYLHAEARLSAAFTLVKHLHPATQVVDGVVFREVIDEVAFHQLVRRELLKTRRAVRKQPAAVESAMRRIVDESLEAEPVVDIYQVAGIDQPNLSLLDDRFLQTHKTRPHPDLRVKLLQRLLDDEIDRKARTNPAKARSFRQMLEETLAKYHARVLDAAMVVAKIIEISRQIDGDERRAKLLGLQPEEVAFYDAVAEKAGRLYDDAFLSALVHEVVQTLKNRLKVGWTEPHRDDVRAAVRVAVRLVLRRVRPEIREVLLQEVMAVAEANFREWPVAA